MKTTIIKKIASSFQAMLNCEESCNVEWYEKHRDKIELLCKNYLPHGSGFDCGTRFDFDASNPNKLVFVTDFHHMDENGYYDGWSYACKIVVVADFSDIGFNIKITGIRRKNRIYLDYWYNTFYSELNRIVEV